nr:Hsp70 family protein [Actinomycetospora corticicola]
MPATAHRGTDGVVRTGADAERRAALEPDRAVRDVSARLGDDVPLIVGDEPWAADDVAAEIVLAAVRRVAALEGGAARSLAVTHPAGWGAHRERTLRRALVRVGLGHAVLVAESRAAVLAAATFGGLRAGRVAAVYDLGGRRFRAAVIRRGARGVVAVGTEGGTAAPGTTTTEVLADSGAPVRAGGTDVDGAVLAHVREELGEPLDEAIAALDDNASRHALAALQQSARRAKERLSTDTEASVRIAVGPLDTTVRITRADLEARITPLVAATVDAFAGTLEAADVVPDQVVLVGGSARIPLVARLLAEELGRPVRPELDPVTVVAEGAALTAAGHANARRQEVLSGTPSGSVPTTGPASGSFAAAGAASGSFAAAGPASGSLSATGPASGSFAAVGPAGIPTAGPTSSSFAAAGSASGSPTTSPASGAFAAVPADVWERRRIEAGRRSAATVAEPASQPNGQALGAPVGAPVERHTAAGAAMTAGAALGASAARRRPAAEPAPQPAPQPTADADGWGPAPEEELRRPARSGSTALMERPRIVGDDVPRPPVATAAAPVGDLAPVGPLRRYRAWILLAVALIALAVVAVAVPIPGLTSARTSTSTPLPTTTAPTPAAAPAAPPLAATAPAAPSPATEPSTEPSVGGQAATETSGSSSPTGTTTRRPATTTTTRSSRTPTAQNLRPQAGAAAPAALAPAPAAPAAPAAPSPVVGNPAPAAVAPSPDVASPVAQAPSSAAAPTAETPVASGPAPSGSAAPTTGTAS